MVIPSSFVFIFKSQRIESERDKQNFYFNQKKIKKIVGFNEKYFLVFFSLYFLLLVSKKKKKIKSFLPFSSPFKRKKESI